VAGDRRNQGQPESRPKVLFVTGTVLAVVITLRIILAVFACLDIRFDLHLDSSTMKRLFAKTGASSANAFPFFSLR
jgi:hypothetical protein